MVRCGNGCRRKRSTELDRGGLHVKAAVPAIRLLHLRDWRRVGRGYKLASFGRQALRGSLGGEVGLVPADDFLTRQRRPSRARDVTRGRLVRRGFAAAGQSEASPLLRARLDNQVSRISGTLHLASGKGCGRDIIIPNGASGSTR